MNWQWYETLISGGTDCYYCINNMTCLIHVLFSCICCHFWYSIHYHATRIPCYTSWYLLRFIWWHTIHVHVYSALYVFCFSIPCRHFYFISQHSCMVILLFISICSYSSRHHYATVILRLNKKFKVIKHVTCYVYTLM